MENTNNNNNNKNSGNKNRRRRHKGNKNNKNRNENVIKNEEIKNQSAEDKNNSDMRASSAEGDFSILSDDDFIYFSDSDKKESNEEKYTFTEEELDAILAEKEPVQDDRPRTEIIGIRFKKVGKMYYFSPNGMNIKQGESAIVETARGLEFGEVCLGNRMVPTDDIIQPLRPVVRIATDEDIAHNKDNSEKESNAFKVCLEKIAEHGLEMKLVDAQYTFDN